MNFDQEQENEQDQEQDISHAWDNEQDTEDSTEQGQSQYEEDWERRNIRIPAWVFAFLAIIIVLDVISMFHFPEVIKDYKSYKLAERRIQNSETSQAIQDLYAVVKKHPDAMPLMEKLVDLSMENGYYDIAGYTIDNYMAGKEVSDLVYNKIESYNTKLANYYAAYDAVDGIFKKETDLTNEESMKAVTQKLEALLGQENMDDSYIYYTLGYITEDPHKKLGYMQKCYEIDPECLDARTQLSIINRRLGNFDLAKKWIQEALHKDKTDSGALRSLAIIMLLENNKEEGLKYSEQAYQCNPDGDYIRETYLIALSVNGKEEEAGRIKKEMTAKNTPVEESTQELLDGKITLTDYYVGE